MFAMLKNRRIFNSRTKTKTSKDHESVVYQQKDSLVSAKKQIASTLKVTAKKCRAFFALHKTKSLKKKEQNSTELWTD